MGVGANCCKLEDSLDYIVISSQTELSMSPCTKVKGLEGGSVSKSTADATLDRTTWSCL